MLTKEEYQREYIRMMDSLRDDCIGELSCLHVSCTVCPLHSTCNANISPTAKPFEFIEAVEKWSKEHPIVTMVDKFKEVFGVEPCTDGWMCPQDLGFCVPDCGNVTCSDCKHRFWNSEYKEPAIKE